MTDTFNKLKRSQIMAAVRSKRNRATELKLIEIFRRHNITGWRRERPMLGKPDFVFPRSKLVVFVDGCFWHGCRKHLRVPSNNRTYWLKKIESNVIRDKATVRKLQTAGWRVLRVWEHELRASLKTALRITKALKETSKRGQIRGRRHLHENIR